LFRQHSALSVNPNFSLLLKRKNPLR